MAKNDFLYIEHMLVTARKIVARASGLTRERYDSDEDAQIVFTHLVQVVGEAAARVSPSTRALHPEIPWQQIVGMRNRLVHDYLFVDLEILWTVVTERVPDLIVLLEPHVSPGIDE